jgi:DivIVA domain-containing protein
MRWSATAWHDRTVTTLLIYLLGLILVGGVLFLLVSFLVGRGEQLAPMPPDAVPVELPDERFATAMDLRALRLPVVLRGYRMHEVDWVLERLANEVDQRDAEIERLTGELAAAAGAAGATAATSAAAAHGAAAHGAAGNGNGWRPVAGHPTAPLPGIRSDDAHAHAPGPVD